MKITELRIANFRCFKKAKLRIAPVTLITGANSACKSSLVAPLLAWAQTDGMPALLSPNGRHVEMGGFREMVHGGEENGEIGVGFTVAHSNYGDMTICNALFGPDRATSGLRLTSLVIAGSDYRLHVEASGEQYEARYTFGRNAQRLLPRAEEMQQDYAKTVNEGTDTAAARYSDAWARQYERWLRWVIDNPATINVEGYLPNPDGEPVQGTMPGSNPLDLEWLLRCIARQTGSAAPYYIAVLVERVQRSLFVGSSVPTKQMGRGSVFVVDKPETHLDTDAQARLANYFVQGAKERDIAFVVETHSEYLLNRLRLLVANKAIAEKEVSVAHIRNSGHEAKLYPIRLQTDGQTVGAPDGFFDTYANDVMQIAMGS